MLSGKLYDDNNYDENDNESECLVQMFVEPYSECTEVGVLACQEGDCSTVMLFWDNMNIFVC